MAAGGPSPTTSHPFYIRQGLEAGGEPVQPTHTHTLIQAQHFGEQARVTFLGSMALSLLRHNRHLLVFVRLAL